MHGWQVSAHYVGDVQEAKNRHGGSWGLVPPACHGVTWAGFDSVFKNKSKPEEREEERSAFENLFSHFQWVSLSTYSLGHIVVNTIFLIIIVWGLWKASRWEQDKPVGKVNMDNSWDGLRHLQQGCGSLGCGAEDPSPAAFGSKQLLWGSTRATAAAAAASMGVL